jgi:hypothetical protein
VTLMDDEAKRTQMGKRGRVRVEQELAWPYQRRAYLEVYRQLTGRPAAVDRSGA